MHSMITKYGEWVYRAILLGAVCIGLYLNSRYVTRADFETLNRQVQKMDTTIQLMLEQNRVNDRQDKTLQDHEDRLRAIEKVILRGM